MAGGSCRSSGPSEPRWTSVWQVTHLRVDLEAESGAAVARGTVRLDGLWHASQAGAAWLADEEAGSCRALRCVYCGILNDVVVWHVSHAPRTGRGGRRRGRRALVRDALVADGGARPAGNVAVSRLWHCAHATSRDGRSTRNVVVVECAKPGSANFAACTVWQRLARRRLPDPGARRDGTRARRRALLELDARAAARRFATGRVGRLRHVALLARDRRVLAARRTREARMRVTR